MSLLFDRDYKLGWGCTLTGRLIPFKGTLPNYHSQATHLAGFKHPSTITCDNPPTFYLGELYKEECRKFFDYCVLFDDQEYWKITWSLTRRKETCKSIMEYQQYCNLYITEIDYGVDVRVIFPKTNLPKDEKELYNLFAESHLNKDQKKIPCKVLINSSEIKEMTLGELMHFTQQVKHEEIHLPSIPISCHFANHDTFLLPHFKKQPDFWGFLWHLYYVFRKIEIKLERVERLDIIYVPKSKEQFPIEDIKDTYKSMDRHDFIEMYPIIKQLFYTYMEYVKDAIEDNAEILEGKHLPGTVDELRKWLRELNSIFIITCPGYGHIIEKLRHTHKFEHWNVIESKVTNQPFIDVNNEEVLFGVIDMKDTEPVEIPKDASTLLRRCPTDCTHEPREWLCMKCGEFVSIKDWILYCSCGRKKYKDRLLICIHQYQCKWDLKQAPVLVTPIRHQQVALQLRQTTKYAKISVIEDDEIHEAYIGDSNGDEHLFGFVDMTEAEHGRAPENSKFLQQACPIDCTNDIRKWVCTKCGDFVHFDDWVLYCSCGSKEYKEEFLFCYYPNHLKKMDPEIKLITTRLQKVVEDRLVVNRKIVEAVNTLSASTNKNEITSILTELQKLPLDEYCQKIIDSFLKNSNYSSIF